MRILLLLIFLVVCVAAVFFVLIQQPKQQGLSSSVGSGDKLFGDRGFEGGLHRITAGLGAAFFILALLLNFVSR